MAQVLLLTLLNIGCIAEDDMLNQSEIFNVDTTVPENEQIIDYRYTPIVEPVLVMGDSIALGVGGKLTSSYTLAAGGERIETTESLWRTRAGSYPSVTTIVVVSGINDIEHYDAEDILVIAKRFISDMRNHDRRVVYLGMTPALCNSIPGRNTPAWYSNCAEYNELINDEKIDIVDLWPLVGDPITHCLLPAYDSGDGLHPNGAGNKVIADYLLGKRLPI